LNASISSHHIGLSRLKLYFALSRTPHGVLDISAPALGALLWLGSFPSLIIVILGLFTAFAGYTAVYALNDVVDYRIDKERVKSGELPASETYLDDVLVRHPMAYGLLSFREGLLWVLAWALIALVGAYILNPICALIFLIGCILEAAYCMMLKISPLRTLISGVVKTSGGIAAVFAVDPHPSPLFLLLLFFMLFCWEVGGQNIPHDWEAIEEDRRLEAKTIPIQWGQEKATNIIFVAIVVAVITTVILLLYSQARLNVLYISVSLLVGCNLLIFPALKLNKTKERSEAMVLFNRASYYPVALLIVVVIKIII
jgi:4-hydroxybenzoate polyprenyltransferase